MQSTAIVIMGQAPERKKEHQTMAHGQKQQKPDATEPVASGFAFEQPLSGFRFGLQHLATTVETGGADVVAQMGFTGGGFHSNTGNNQRIVRTVHTALGRRLFVLLDGHDPLLGKGVAQDATRWWLVKMRSNSRAKPKIIAQSLACG
jgi:hypothetical protein